VGQSPEQALGRFVLHHVPGQQGEKRRGIGQLPHDEIAQLPSQAGVAVHAPQVEKGGELQTVLRLGVTDPFAEVPLPLIHGLAPAGIAGHHAPLARRIPRLLQPAGHLLGQGLEVGHRGLSFPAGRRTKQDGAVLIRQQRLFPPPLAAQGQIHPGDGRRTQLGLGEGRQFLRHRVRDGRDGPTDMLGPGAAVQQAAHDGRQPPPALEHLLRAAGLADAAGQEGQGIVIHLQEVAGMEYAHHRAVGLLHHQVAHAPVMHHPQRLVALGRAGDAEDGRAHDFVRGRGQRHAPGHHPLPQIPVREHAQRLAGGALHDQGVRSVPHHELGGKFQ